MILRAMSTADAIGLVVDMARRMFRLQDQAIDVGLIEVKDPGFMMVDPDDRVIEVGHERHHSVFLHRLRKLQQHCVTRGVWELPRRI